MKQGLERSEGEPVSDAPRAGAEGSVWKAWEISATIWGCWRERGRQPEEIKPPGVAKGRALGLRRCPPDLTSPREQRAIVFPLRPRLPLPAE